MSRSGRGIQPQAAKKNHEWYNAKKTLLHKGKQKKGAICMGYQIGLPCLKLSNEQGKSGKHCGNFAKVAAEALGERRGNDPDIDRTQTDQNEYLTAITSAAELMQFSEKWIADYNARMDVAKEDQQRLVDQYISDHGDSVSRKDALKAIKAERAAAGEPPLPDTRHIKKDAVVMCAVVIKPPAEYMSQLSRDQQRQLLLDAYAKLCEIVGQDRMKAAVIHFDELNPHLHAFWIPETADGRLCAKELHNLKYLGRLNREMPEHLRQCGWDIADCHAYDAEEEQRLREEMGDAAYRQHKREQRSKRGRESTVFKHEAQAAVDDLTEQRDSLQAAVDDLTEDKRAFEQQIATKKKEISDLQRQIEDIGSIVKGLTFPEPPRKPKYPSHTKIEQPKKEWVNDQLEFENLGWRERQKRKTQLDLEYDQQAQEWHEQEQYEADFASWQQQTETIRAMQALQKQLEDQEKALKHREEAVKKGESAVISVHEQQLGKQVKALEEELRRTKSLLDAALKDLAQYRGTTPEQEKTRVYGSKSIPRDR